MEYVTDTKEYEELLKIGSYLKRNFAHWNNEDEKKYYYDWSEFDVRGFLPYIKELAEIAGDKEFYFYDIDIEPEIIKEYYKHFFKYPILKFSLETTEDEYFKALSEIVGEINGRYFMIRVTSNYAIFPPSLKWHAYGEYDIELGKLVSTVDFPVKTPFPHDFIPEEEAVELIKLYK